MRERNHFPAFMNFRCRFFFHPLIILSFRSGWHRPRHPIHIGMWSRNNFCYVAWPEYKNGLHRRVKSFRCEYQKWLLSPLSSPKKYYIRIYFVSDGTQCESSTQIITFCFPFSFPQSLSTVFRFPIPQLQRFIFGFVFFFFDNNGFESRSI